MDGRTLAICRLFGIWFLVVGSSANAAGWPIGRVRVASSASAWNLVVGIWILFGI